MSTDPINAFVEHVLGTGHDDVPESARAATRRYLLDSLGVGVAGTRGPWVSELLETQAASLGGSDARVLVDGRRLSAAGAAMCNGYLIHNSEFDCVHERAVIHTMTVPTACALAVAERGGGVTGRELVTALALGVDVACGLGIACREGLRFFRPAVAGAMGATATVGRLLGFDRTQLLDAFGIVHAQLSGTMQAHTEGSLVLPLQIGFNARNVIIACDMAAAGLTGTREILEGDFGYFALFEGEHDLAETLDGLGRTWRIEEVAYKPFPSGRATHGAVDACLRLKGAHGFAAGDVKRAIVRVPRLVNHLVGRPVHDDMHVNYARLCLTFACAVALIEDGMRLKDFVPDALRDPERLALAGRFEVVVDDNPDPNALTPVAVAIELADGRTVETGVDTVYGNPANTMTAEAAHAKLLDNLAFAGMAEPEALAEALSRTVADLDELDDVTGLMDRLVAAS